LNHLHDNEFGPHIGRADNVIGDRVLLPSERGSVNRGNSPNQDALEIKCNRLGVWTLPRLTDSRSAAQDTAYALALKLFHNFAGSRPSAMKPS
jgi:hypothetical protein